MILDGWDEIDQTSLSPSLGVLFNHPTLIMTSRPHGVDLSQTKPFDLELETMGFSPANVTEYLEHKDIVPLEKGVEIKHFIQQNPFVRELVNIPIQLDALCYSWDTLQQEPAKRHTMTGLYQAMLHTLWKKDIPRLKKSLMDSLLRIRTLRTSDDLLVLRSW